MHVNTARGGNADDSRPPQATQKALTTAEVLAESTPADWRPIDPQNTLYMDLPAGRVIIELAPQFAPHYVANVETLARQGYFNGLWVERVQDNYVAQWGDPEGKKPVGNAQQHRRGGIRAHLARPVFHARWRSPTPMRRKLDFPTASRQRSTRNSGARGSSIAMAWWAPDATTTSTAAAGPSSTLS